MKFSFHHRKVKKKTLISSIQNHEIIIFLFTKRKQSGVYEEKKASFRTWRRLLIRALPSRKYKTMPYPTTSTIAHTIGCTTKQKNMFSSPSHKTSISICHHFTRMFNWVIFIYICSE